MHIAIEATPLTDDRRGIGRYTRNVLRGLARVNDDVHFTLYVHPKNADAVRADLDALGISPKRGDIQPVNLLRSASFDLCWVPFSYSKYLPQKGPIAVTIHDVSPLVFPDQRPARWFPSYKFIRRWHRTAAAAGLILTDSEFSRGEISRWLGVPADRIRVALLGADDFTPGDPATAGGQVRALGVEGRYALYVGGHEERKNLARLLRAYAFLRTQDRFDCRLVLVGPSQSLPATLVPLLEDKVVRDAVYYFGNVDDTTLQALYRGARALVYPSIYEGFGLPILEAMASGAPVVAASSSSIPEVAGDSALYFHPLDERDLARQLLRVVTDDGLRDALIAKGSAQVARFHWADTVGITWDAFRALTGGQGSGARAPDEGLGGASASHLAKA